MIRITARYRNQKLELDQPIDLEEGTQVVVEMHPAESSESADWSETGMERLEQEWENPQDAVYDDWRKLYSVQTG
ncbi:MAG: hypothetical protein AB7I48_18035 [Planctomycetaceae bacterium]